MQLDDLAESVGHEDAANNSEAFMPGESRVSDKRLQTYSAYKNQHFRNNKEPEAPSTKTALHRIPVQKAAPREIPLWEVIKYYKTLIVPDTEVFSNRATPARYYSRTSHAGLPDIQLTDLYSEINDLLTPYAISVESFNALRSILRDNSVLALRKSGEIVNLEPLLKPILLDDYTVASYDLDYAPQNGAVPNKRNSSGNRVFSFKELIGKLIDLLSHPISIMIYLVFLFFILPVMLAFRRTHK